MIALVQRVTQASVSVDGRVIGSTGPGMLVLCCVQPGDTPETIAKAAAKTARLRIFSDEAGRMNRSLLDTGGSALVVSQFTLSADTRHGNRPSFSGAASPEAGLKGYQDYVDALRALGVPVEAGEFGADMQVALVNDGPATFWLEV